MTTSTMLKNVCRAVLMGAVLLFVGTAQGGVMPAPGFQATHIATGYGSTTSLIGAEYNPVTDTWLGIDTTGFDYINEANRGGTYNQVDSSFDLGGLGDDTLAVTGNNVAWVIEPHARTVYKLVPATVGAVRTLTLNLPGDTNTTTWGEHAVAEADANGDMIVGVGPWDGISPSYPPQANAPRDWFRVDQAGSVTSLFGTTYSIISWLERDAATGLYYGVDTYDPAAGGDWPNPYHNPHKPSLVTLDVATGALSTIESYDDSYLADIEMDRTGQLVLDDVIWAILDHTQVVPIDPVTGEIGAPILTATEGFTFHGLGLAPGPAGGVALYVAGREPAGDPDVNHLWAVVPEPATLSLLALGGLGLFKRRTARRPRRGTPLQRLVGAAVHADSTPGTTSCSMSDRRQVCRWCCLVMVLLAAAGTARASIITVDWIWTITASGTTSGGAAVVNNGPQGNILTDNTSFSGSFVLSHTHDTPDPSEWRRIDPLPTGTNCQVLAGWSYELDNPTSDFDGFNSFASADIRAWAGGGQPFLLVQPRAWQHQSSSDSGGSSKTVPITESSPVSFSGQVDAGSGYGVGPGTVSASAALAMEGNPTEASVPIRYEWIPEPATMSLLAAGGLALVCRRRK